MPRKTSVPAACLGFRVRTGRAIVVALGGPAANPRILFRREVELCDPRVPESRQPHHAGIMPFAPAAPKAVARGRKAAERVALAVVKGLADELAASGHKLSGVALVVASNPNPQRLGNEHIRAHALEGILFREVLEAGAKACRIPACTILEREAHARATAALRRPAAELSRAVARFGGQVGSPWRAWEKSAALGAWLALAV
ncbi:MAG TPA: hypothetical protein VKG84_14385 [Candidatus Acidoferrales bacterium]|nr:hypothetical protein [Candidatus Acidoferrales bacterium]